TGRDAGARSATPSTQKKGALPPGHPPTDTNQGALPPGHPATGAPDDEGEGEDESLPPGHPPTGAGEPAPARERLPEDTSNVDEQLPVGAIAVEVRDPSNQPIP